MIRLRGARVNVRADGLGWLGGLKRESLDQLPEMWLGR